MTDRGTTLLAVARAALEEALTGAPAKRPEGAPWLDEPAAVFVTLTVGGELRGCVGTLEPVASLYDAVRRAAVSAALHDDRFPPLGAAELPDVRVEVSVLSRLEPLDVESEADALAKIRPGTDGLLLSWRGRRGTFIPEMWKKLPDPRDFLRHLRRKAGLPADTWMPGTRLARYTAEAWHEPD